MEKGLELKLLIAITLHHTDRGMSDDDYYELYGKRRLKYEELVQHEQNAYEYQAEKVLEVIKAYKKEKKGNRK